MFSGSTNRDDYLTDPDGERRFWIAKITASIDLIGLAHVRDALWKEAYDAYLTGEGWHLEGEANRQATVIQQGRVAEDTLKTDIEDCLQPLTSTCVRQVKDKLKERGILLQGSEHQQNMRINAILKSLGFNKSYRGNVGAYKNVRVHSK